MLEAQTNAELKLKSLSTKMPNSFRFKKRICDARAQRKRRSAHKHSTPSAKSRTFNALP